MHFDCYALLDDASTGDGPAGAQAHANPDAPARSRLYTGHAGTLACHDAAGWLALLQQMQQALAAGQHAVAVCSYELGAQVLAVPGLQPQPTPAGPAPELARVLLFRHCQHLTQAEVAAWLTARAALDSPDSPDGSVAAGVAGVHANLGPQQFCAALARIHAYIEAGDTYQINYTYRLHFDAYGAPCVLYARLRARQPVPYGALIAFEDGSAVLSLSPELFVAHRQGQLTARPMKGTAPAAAPEQAQENARRSAALAADSKNRAENLMIVDLLRNDIGRVAVTGTVTVPKLFDVQCYGAVLQMTSTIVAQLRADATLAQIFAALYPCGSITGAPKRRSMEIIDQLEPAARGIYTGAIGWFAPAPAQMVGDFCLSVPIRTLSLQAPAHGVRRGQMGVGAGIVYDSDAAEEYAECQLKARFLTGLGHDFALFETMHASRAGGVRHLERHLQRLAASASYFGFVYDEAQLRSSLAQACAGFAEPGAQRLRLALTAHGAVELQSAGLTRLTEPVGLLIAAEPIAAEQLLVRHKTTMRARYDAGWRAAEARGGFDTVLVNQRGEITEGGRSNIFLKLDGHWFTPPLASGLLPGVMRAVLLDDPAWAARERVLTVAMLRQAQQIVVCNALRGPLRAHLLDE